MTPMYDIIRSNRKTIAIQIKGDGQLIVRAPLRMPKAEVMAFVDKKKEWIEKHLNAIAQRQTTSERPFTAAELKELTTAAEEDIAHRVAWFAPIVGVSYARVTIRAQKSRWGSCSAKGNLNFNCLLMLCPEDVRDYVVVHELCHRKELNHSPQFWNEVRRVLPFCDNARKWLKISGVSLIRRIP